MKMLKRKLIGIPVWAVALMLIVGTVAGAGIWILTVEVPVEYDEPVEIYYGSEDMETEWFGPIQLRDTRRTDATDLTYGTLHDYIRAYNPTEGKETVELTVEIDGLDGEDGTPTDHLGFVVIDDEDAYDRVDPQDVTWDYDGEGNRETAIVGEDEDEFGVEWESTDFSHELGQDGEAIYTVIIVARQYDDAGDPIDVDGYEIVWTVYDSTDQD